MKSVLWSWPELCRAVHIEETDGPAVSGISIDTRTLESGDLFVALSGDPGPRFNTASRSDRDGHAYVPSAVSRGAAGLLVSHPTRTGARELLVEDTLDGLWDLGRAARARFAGQVVGVTGSSGKTTVKSFLAAALGCAAAQGSLNNFWGVPLSLARTPRARTPAGADSAIFEIGTNHPGEIAPLAELVKPDVAVVLNVLPAHIEYFESFEALKREKLSIAEGLVSGGTLVLPDDLDTPPDYLHPNEANCVRFGQTESADVRLLSYDAAARSARLRVGDLEFDARVPGGGEHRALSLTATVACLVALGRDPQLASGLSDDLVPRGRGARDDIDGITIIDDSYNANPVSMRAALRELRELPGAHRYALLGEMLELGDQSEAFHAGLVPDCEGLDGVLCVGGGMQALHDALPGAQRLGWIENPNEVDLAALAERFERGDRVLVKGSNRVFWANDFVSRLSAAIQS